MRIVSVQLSWSAQPARVVSPLRGRRSKWQPRNARAGNPAAASTAKLQAKRWRARCVVGSVERFARERVAKAAKSKVESRRLPLDCRKPARKVLKTQGKNPAEIIHATGLLAPM